jgi:hypothetical protein
VFANHHEVNFTPGPFYMRGWGVYVNGVMLLWTLFEVTILCFPETYPLTWDTFNYAVSGSGPRFAVSTFLNSTPSDLTSFDPVLSIRCL